MEKILGDHIRKGDDVLKLLPPPPPNPRALDVPQCCEVAERRVTLSIPDELRVVQFLPKVLSGPYRAAHLILEVEEAFVEDWDYVENALHNARAQQKENSVTLQNESIKS